MFFRLKACGSALLCCLLLLVPVYGQSGGTWQTLAPMPSKRQELATAVLNGKIYVIGGYDVDGNSTATVEVYDPDSDTWASAHPIPFAVNHNSAAVAAGKLYSFGASGKPAYVYDPANDSWAPVASMNFEHGGTAAVGVIGDKIYVAGGNGASMRQLEVYDPVANTWTIRAEMAVGRNHTGGGVIDGKFYVVGGRGEANSATALEVYDPQTNSWSSRAPMPTGRSGIGVAAVSGELWVFGGEVPVLHGEVEVYNPGTNTWRSLPDMPTPRHGISASVIANRIYLPGGGVVQGFGASDVNEVFIVAVTTFAQWRQMHFTPEELSNPAVSGENARSESQRTDELARLRIHERSARHNDKVPAVCGRGAEPSFACLPAVSQRDRSDLHRRTILQSGELDGGITGQCHSLRRWRDQADQSPGAHQRAETLPATSGLAPIT